MSVHALEPRSSNCQFEFNVYFSREFDNGYMDIENERHNCSAKNDQFVNSRRGIGGFEFYEC